MKVLDDVLFREWQMLQLSKGFADSVRYPEHFRQDMSSEAKKQNHIHCMRIMLMRPDSITMAHFHPVLYLIVI